MLFTRLRNSSLSVSKSASELCWSVNRVKSLYLAQLDFHRSHSLVVRFILSLGASDFSLATSATLATLASQLTY